MLIVLAFLGVLQGLLASPAGPPPLVQVFLIFRHGTRTPADTYPTDPYLHHDFAPYSWGQLTNTGKKEAFSQGEWLAGRYAEPLLGGLYSPETLEAWSTDSDRTKMSLQLCLAGFLPPRGPQAWNKDLNWQPIPYTTQPLSQDSLLLVRNCPRYAEAIEEVMRLPEVEAQVKEFDQLYSFLSNKTGRPVPSPEHVQDVYSTLKAEEVFGLALPEWTKDVYPEPMAKATALSFTLNAYTPELRRLKGGQLLKKILKDINSLKEGKSKKKVYMYAGHDSTVSNLMRALGTWETQVPNYNILSIIEVYDTGSDYAIKVLLRNTTDHDPYSLRIPGCEELCPLNKVVQLTKEVIPVDIKEECKAKSEGFTPPKESGP